MKNLKLVLLIAILLASGASFSWAGELRPVKALVHLNSSISSGKYSPEELVDKAHAKGINAVFLTENLFPRWEYGLKPFRNIIKRSVERKGLVKFGTVKYERLCDKLNGKYDNFSVLMSAEVAPYYFWTGSPFEKEFVLNDWDIQFLVMGLDAEGFEGIPTVSNKGFEHYNAHSVFLLWPFILIAFGVFALLKKTPRLCLPNFVCWIIIVIGVVFVLYNYPFRIVRFDQYKGEMQIEPYQEVINYVNKKGGMLFWSHPEALVRKKVGPVTYAATTSKEHMLMTDNYTGFCVFYEGYRGIGGPGAIWDIILKEYCDNTKVEPVWAIGEVSFHAEEGSSVRKEIDEVQTVFFVKENTRKNILNSMKKGNMYAIRKSKTLELELVDFSVTDSKGDQARMGGELYAQGPIAINFDIKWKGKLEEPVSVKLIKNGEIIKEFSLESFDSLEFNDTSPEYGKMDYYRLDIRGKYPSMLFSNPIFVRGAE